jgi:hypothetical protein
MARKSSAILAPKPVETKAAKPSKPLTQAQILRDSQAVLKQLRIDVLNARKVLAEAEMKAAAQEKQVKRLMEKKAKAAAAA